MSFKYYLEKITHNFARNILALMSGTIIAQTIPVLLSPVLTRIFTPDDFGLFGLYFSIIMILSVFIMGRYEMAIILPKDDVDSANLVVLSFVLALLISITFLAVITIWGDTIFDIFKVQEIKKWSYLIPFSIFLIGISQISNYWLNRKENYTAMASAKVVRSSISVTGSICTGLTVLKPGGLIIGDTIGYFSQSVFVIIKAWQGFKEHLKFITVKKIILLAKRYRKFPQFNVLSGLFGKGTEHVPLILITSFYGVTIAGLYTLSQRVIALPGGVIANAIGDVFRLQASKEYADKGNCQNTFLKVFGILILISIIPFGILFSFAPALFNFIFGSDWYKAGIYARILTPMFFLQFTVSPLSTMFYVAERQLVDMIIKISSFTLITLSFIVGNSLMLKPESVLMIFSAIYCVKYLVEGYLSWRYSIGNSGSIKGIQR